MAASGDGCLSGWNLAKGDVDGISENLNDEILSLALMPDGERLLCGTQDGVVNLFEWGAWGEPVGSYRGHPASISSIVVVDNNSVFTGSSDGLIRVVQVAPHKIYGVFGDCGDLPVEELRLSHDNSLLASVSHDLAVRFWDVREYFVDEMEADDDDDDDIDEKDDDSDSDDNDDMEEEEEKEEDEDEDEDIVALDKKKRKLSDDADDDDLSDGSDSDDDKSTKKVNAKQQQKQKQKKQPQQKAQQKKKNSGGNNNNKKKKNKKKKKKKGFFGGL